MSSKYICSGVQWPYKIFGSLVPCYRSIWVIWSLDRDRLQFSALLSTHDLGSQSRTRFSQTFQLIYKFLLNIYSLPIFGFFLILATLIADNKMIYAADITRESVLMSKPWFRLVPCGDISISTIALVNRNTTSTQAPTSCPQRFQTFHFLHVLSPERLNSLNTAWQVVYLFSFCTSVKRLMATNLNTYNTIHPKESCFYSWLLNYV